MFISDFECKGTTNCVGTQIIFKIYGKNGQITNLCQENRIFCFFLLYIS